MRQLIKDFVQICAQELPISSPIYEFGSLQVPGQEGFADLRPFFLGKEYVGCDMRPGTGVDRILDMHETHLPSESVGTALTMDTLEHVEYPRRAMDEIYRILKPNGVAIISSVMNFVIHDYPSDYWRFTPEGFKSLLKKFDTVIVDHVGDPSFPHTVVGVGIKGTVDENRLDCFLSKLALWRERNLHQF